MDLPRTKADSISGGGRGRLRRLLSVARRLPELPIPGRPFELVLTEYHVKKGNGKKKIIRSLQMSKTVASTKKTTGPSDGSSSSSTLSGKAARSSKVDVPQSTSTGSFQLCSCVRRNLLLILTVVGVVLGVGVGAALRTVEPSVQTIALINFPGEIMLNLLKMVVVPLVVVSLIASQSVLPPRPPLLFRSRPLGGETDGQDRRHRHGLLPRHHRIRCHLRNRPRLGYPPWKARAVQHVHPREDGQDQREHCDDPPGPRPKSVHGESSPVDHVAGPDEERQTGIRERDQCLG